MKKVKKQIVLIATFIFMFQCFSFGQGSAYTGSYKPSAPIVWNGISNQTISGLSFTNVTGNSITLNECSNITIENCKISKSTGIGIGIENGNNIIIQNCEIDSVSTGVEAVSYSPNPFNGGVSSGIKILHNYFRNIIGAMPRGQAVQFNGVKGGGNRVNYNSIEGIDGRCQVEDNISIYKSYGLPTDPIEVIGNWIRGGGPSTTGSGIMTGDFGGAYIHVKNNILVNAGHAGIGNAGGNHITIENNTVFSNTTYYSTTNGTGIFITNFTSGTTDCSSNTIQNNRIYYIQSNGNIHNLEDGSKCGTITGWNTNISDPTLNGSILPANIGRAKAITTGTISTPVNVNFKVYPNPAYGVVTIETPANLNNDKIIIYNLKGQKLLEQSLIESKTDIDISNFIMGVYIVKLSNDNNQTEVKKIIVGKKL